MARSVFDRLSAASLTIGASLFAFCLGAYSIGGRFFWIGWRMDCLDFLSGRPVPGHSVTTATLLMAALAFLPLVWLADFLMRLPGQDRRRRRLSAGLCGTCGYDVRASFERCPECGTDVGDSRPVPVPPPAPPDPARRALASLATAVAVICACVLVFNLPPREHHSSDDAILLFAAFVFFTVTPAAGLRLGVLALRARTRLPGCAFCGAILNGLLLFAAAFSSLFLLVAV